MQCSNSSIYLSRDFYYLAKLTKFYKIIVLVLLKVVIDYYSALVYKAKVLANLPAKFLIKFLTLSTNPESASALDEAN
jgi:hypothetical protein